MSKPKKSKKPTDVDREGRLGDFEDVMSALLKVPPKPKKKRDKPKK